MIEMCVPREFDYRSGEAGGDTAMATVIREVDHEHVIR